MWRLDAIAQAELVRSRALAGVELVQAALDRAEQLDSLQAATVLFPARALERAAVATGPFAGVPILLKDAGQELAGTPLWMGTTVLRQAGYISTTTTDLAGALEAMGFVVIGKSAVPELTAGITTEPPVGPPTRNPWAEERTVGGSSGGSAAAVAAGVVAVAHGSDSTGSLRYPASCCGILTLKPSAGLIPSRLPGGIADPLDAHVDFVLARSERDLRSVFATLTSAAANSSASPIRRVARLTAMPFGFPIDSVVDEVLDDSAEELAGLGLQVDSIPPRFLESYGTVLGRTIPTIVDAHRAAVVDWIETEIERPIAAGNLSPSVIEAAERGRRLHRSEVIGAWAALGEAARVAAGWAGGFDALLLPILDVPPWPIGTSGPDGRLAGLVCSLANFSGQPAVVVPTVRDGLPVGVQIQAPAGHDLALLDLLQSIRPVAPQSPYLHV